MTTVRVTSSLNPSMDSSFAALEVFTSCPWFQKTNSNSPFLDFLVISQQIAPCFHNIFPMELYPCNILRVAWGLFLCVRVGGLFVLFVWFGSFFFFPILYSEHVTWNAVFQQPENLLPPYLAPFSRLSSYASRYLPLRRENGLWLGILFYIYF